MGMITNWGELTLLGQPLSGGGGQPRWNGCGLLPKGLCVGGSVLMMAALEGGGTFKT